MLGVYAFIGGGCQCFIGKGKVTPLKKLTKYPKFHSTFSKLDKEWIVLEDVTKYLEKFVCVMFGYVQETEVNMVKTQY